LGQRAAQTRHQNDAGSDGVGGPRVGALEVKHERADRRLPHGLCINTPAGAFRQREALNIAGEQAAA
jgi:hypothetical protein